jgi:probable addiction module antidote protein
MPKKTASYRDWLIAKLSDPRRAARYLNAALQDSRPMFLKALRKVAEAHQVSKVASAAGLQRESVYRMLSEDGNPRLDSLWAILQAADLRLTVEPAPCDVKLKHTNPKSTSGARSKSRA